MTVFVSNTSILDLVGLKNEITLAFINNATVTVTVKDTSGVAVSGQTWPLTMSYLAASDGNYRGFLSDQIAFTPKTKYIAYIDANGGSNLVGHWELDFKPLSRIVQDA